MFSIMQSPSWEFQTKTCRRWVCSQAPKGLDNKAQDKRSAALGKNPKCSALRRLHNGGRRNEKPFQDLERDTPPTQGFVVRPRWGQRTEQCCRPDERIAAYQGGYTRTRARSESPATTLWTLLTSASRGVGTAPVSRGSICGLNAEEPKRRQEETGNRMAGRHGRNGENE